MKYKALFLDLDGTTIPNKRDGMPSPHVTEAIHKAKKHVFVCIATSRPLFIARHIIDHLDIRGLCSVNDSTQIYDPVKKKFLQTIYIDSICIPKIMRIAKRFGVKLVMNNGRSERIAGEGWKKTKVCSLYIPSVAPEIAERIIEDLTKIPNIAVHKILSWTKGEISISMSHITATKLHSVVRVAELLGVKTEEMIGVGDGYNDYPLLSACGLKIAMGNAAPELKAIADFIAPTVDEDGVATVIEKFILS
ncbi:MAG: HAD family hydrolase [Patescibacteria group bacterium]